MNRMLAMRFLFSKRRERFLSVASWVAIFGMGFGVAALLISLSIISGFQKEYKKAILGFNSHLILLKEDEIEDPDQVAQEIEKIIASGGSKMVGSTPFIYREGMAISGTGKSSVKGIVLKGVDFERYSELSRMTFHRYPSAENPENLPTLFLGKKLAEELDPKDRTVKILAGLKTVRRFFVEGTFESGLFEYDSSFAFLSLPVAQKFFQTDGRVSGLEIWIDDPDRAESWAHEMRRDFEYPYVVMTWRSLNENIFRALEQEKILFTLLMIVLFGVASLNVLGTIMMLLLGKREEIAILRAIGFSWRRLRQVFLFDGLLIGSVGIIFGILLGFGGLFFLDRWKPIELAPEIYFLRSVPVDFSWKNFAEVILSAFLVLFIGCEVALRGISRIPVIRALLEA